MPDTIIIIQQGDPVEVDAPITFLGTGSEGNPDACRRLVFPTAVDEGDTLAPLVYSIAGLCWNPARTLNFDKVPLPHPTRTAVKTAGTTRVTETGEELEDVIVTEIWQARGGASMTSAFFRLLYEYFINQPPFTLTGQNFIQWEPRDRSTRTYNVQLLSLSVGGRGESQFDVADIFDAGGEVRGGPYASAVDGLNTLPTGVIDEDVELRMRIVSEVVALSRALDPLLDSLQTESNLRQPAFTVQIFDVRSTTTEITPTTIGDVVLFNLGVIGTLPADVGPRDFTDEVEFVDLTETAGDFIDAGIASSVVQGTIVDASGELDPLGGAEGRWLRQGNVLVLRAGDSQVPQADWPIVFTGKLVGQPGSPGTDRNGRAAGARLTIKAVSREQDYLRQESTSINFPQSTSLYDIVVALATDDLGLDPLEQNLPATFGAQLTCHLSTQFVLTSPLVSIANAMFPDGFMPRFDGFGRLGVISGIITKSPTRIYTSDTQHISIERPLTEENGTNVLQLKGLGCDQVQVQQERQVLARANVTLGFFSSGMDLPVQWSDDGTQQANDTRLEVIRSINAGIFNVGDEDYEENTDADGGARSGVIRIENNPYIKLIPIINTLILESAKTPDGVGVVQTVPLGRLIEAFWDIAAKQALATVATAQYEVTGLPYEYVFPEIVAEARTATTPPDPEQVRVIENQLVNTQAAADTIVQRVFRRERAKQNVRKIQMLQDLKLTPDDVFQIESGRRYMIQSITSRFDRTTNPSGLASYDCFEVTPGVLP